MARITRRGFFTTAAAAGAMPMLAGIAGAPAARAQAQVTVERDIAFGTGAGTELRLDVYRPPAGVSKRMATIHLHGGGFVGGSKEAIAERVRPFAELGYVAVASQYRLSGSARWPAQIHDVKAAIRWVRAHAEALAIDAERIALVGHSAGGHLALFAAGTADRPEFEGNGGNAQVSTRVAACFPYYAAIELTPRADGTAHPLLPAGSDAAAHREASPIAHVAAGFPPTAIFHGTEDVTIRLETSERLFARLREVGVPAELHAFDGVPHAFDVHPEFAEMCARLADFFLERHVLAPRTYPPFGAGG